MTEWKSGDRFRVTVTGVIRHPYDLTADVRLDGGQAFYSFPLDNAERIAEPLKVGNSLTASELMAVDFPPGALVRTAFGNHYLSVGGGQYHGQWPSAGTYRAEGFGTAVTIVYLPDNEKENTA